MIRRQSDTSTALRCQSPVRGSVTSARSGADVASRRRLAAVQPARLPGTSRCRGSLLPWLAFALAACAHEYGFGIPTIPLSPNADIQADKEECGTMSSIKPYIYIGRTYMACMISKGYRTYVTVGAPDANGSTQVMVSSPHERSAATVEQDLIACGQEVDGVVGRAAGTSLARAIVVAAKYQQPFIACMQSRGYTADPWRGER